MTPTQRLTLALALTLLPTTAIANPLEERLAKTWQGAWVVLKTEAASDCDIFHTRNRVIGRESKSWGDHRFARGELGRISAVDVKRDFIKVRIRLAEPILDETEDGPFTLLEERNCRIQLRIVVPRDALEAYDQKTAESRLVAAIARYATPEEAAGDWRWNRRHRAPYPEDYATTLEDWADWKEAKREAEE